MGFYTFEIDLPFLNMYVISTPFELYKYKRLLMGITNSPEFFQSVMHPLFADLPEVECFIYDIGIFSIGSFSNHLQQLQWVTLMFERNGYTANLLKCEWAASSTEHLGFLITSRGIKPLPHKIKAITTLAQPSSTKHVRSFVGEWIMMTICDPKGITSSSTHWYL